MGLHVDDPEQFLADYENRNELGWDELQRKYGPATTNAFRVRVCELRKKSAPPLSSYFTDAGPLDDDSLSTDEVVSQASKSQERALTRARVARRRERALAQTQIGYEDLIDALRDEFARGPQITVTPPRPSRSTEKPVLTPQLIISDLHGGPVYKRDKMQGLGEFNWQIFAQRIERLADATLEIIEALRAFHTINRMGLLFAGDNFEGRTIFEGQDRETFGLLSQFRLSTQTMHEGLLAPLAETVPDIFTVKVPGNHGRLGRKEDNLDPVEDSLDLLWMDYLELRCAGIPNITWDHEDGEFKLYKLHGWQFLLHHGDRSSGGEGHTPVVRARARKRDFESLSHMKIDVSISGHLHSAGLAMDGFSTNVTNGSVPGASPYGLGLGLNAPPIQTLITTSDKFPIHGHFPIWLATRQECLSVYNKDLDRAV